MVDSFDIGRIYTNLFMVSLLRHVDFRNALFEAENETKKILSESSQWFPKGYEGICFTECLARIMDATLGEVCNLQECQKKQIVKNILDYFNSENDFNFNSEKNYCFAGVYITTGYTRYKVENRKHS